VIVGALACPSPIIGDFSIPSMFDFPRDVRRRRFAV
jgi:hypothetical protein